MRKKEIIIFAVILAAALSAMALQHRNRQQADYGEVTITVNGEEYGTYSLASDQKVKINGTNTLRIKDHEAKMIEASCPDHLCIHQSSITSHGGMIVCLPNQVVVQGTPSAEASTEMDGIDSIAN